MILNGTPCDPHSMRGFQKIANRKLRYFVHQLGRAYFGKRNWQSGSLAVQVSTCDYVTANYPDTFLTDGNAGSFEAQAKAMEKKLKALRVPVQSLFYPVDAGTVPHEYQFAYDKFADRAQECFLQTLDFLNARMK